MRKSGAMDSAGTVRGNPELRDPRLWDYDIRPLPPKAVMTHDASSRLPRESGGKRPEMAPVIAPDAIKTGETAIRCEGSDLPSTNHKRAGAAKVLASA